MTQWDNEGEIWYVGHLHHFTTATLEVEVIIALGTGLLILMLNRRADSKIHRVIHKQHELIDEIHRKLHEQHELIKRMQDTS
jgi:hypothetical protein